MGVILWTSLVALGMLVFIMLWGWLGLAVYATVNVSVAYYFNQSRKHTRPDAFDDRLTSERMEAAREWMLNREKDD